MMRSFTLLCFLCFIHMNAWAFQKTLTTSQFYEQIINAKSKQFTLKNIELKDDIGALLDQGKDFYKALGEKIETRVRYDSMGLITNVQSLRLEGISGTTLELKHLNIDSITIRRVTFNDLWLSHLRTNDLHIDSSKVVNAIRLENSFVGSFEMATNEMADFIQNFNEYKQHVMILLNKVSGMFFVNDCLFKEGAYLSADVDGAFIDFAVERCVFEPIDSALPIPVNPDTGEEVIMKSQLRINLFGDVDQAIIADNVFESDPIDQFIYIEGDYDYMTISGNEFGAILYPAATVIKQFIMDDNQFKTNIILSEFNIQGNNNILRWSEMEGFKLATSITEVSQMSEKPEDFGYTRDDALQIFEQTSDIVHVTYRAKTNAELENSETFQRLISSYYRLYKTFKENGQMATSNQVYIEMKDVQSRELAYRYNTYGGLERWIEWRLNTILQLYTDYGTSPSKAIRISIWIISLFQFFIFSSQANGIQKARGSLSLIIKSLSRRTIRATSNHS